MNTRVAHRDEYARSSSNFIITADLTSPNDELRNLGHACIVIGARRPARYIIDIQYDTKICSDTRNNELLDITPDMYSWKEQC